MMNSIILDTSTEFSGYNVICFENANWAVQEKQNDSVNQSQL